MRMQIESGFILNPSVNADGSVPLGPSLNPFLSSSNFVNFVFERRQPLECFCATATVIVRDGLGATAQAD